MTDRTLNKTSVRDLNVEGRRVFVRVDFNVPLESGRITDDTRIQAALPTIRLLLERQARVILASHLGRPKGQVKSDLSLRPVADHLSRVLTNSVRFSPECVGAEAENAVKSLLPGQVLLLENLRFHEGETSNDAAFAGRLASLAEEYVNDAFGTAHRAHASTVGVPEALGRGAAGLLIQNELQALSQVLIQPEHPVVALFGGAKVSDKIDVIQNFLGLADSILLGGGMAFTFLKARGHSIGRSLLEEEKIETARSLMDKASESDVDFELPRDVRVAPRAESGVENRIVPADEIPDDWMGLDIGPRSVEVFGKRLEQARTLIWNGPLGMFELDEFAGATNEMAHAVARSDAFSVVGGGDSVAAINKAGLADRISHMSTGGGASLDFLAGKKLPGIEILSDREPVE